MKKKICGINYSMIILFIIRICQPYLVLFIFNYVKPVFCVTSNYVTSGWNIASVVSYLYLIFSIIRIVDHIPSLFVYELIKEDDKIAE